MKYISTSAIIIAVLAAAGPAIAQSSHIERRPCVSPGSPPGCDGSISTGPMLSPGAGGPSPDMRRPASSSSTFQLPLNQTPEPVAPPPPPEGSVTVGPADAKTPATQPRVPGASGPPAPR